MSSSPAEKAKKRIQISGVKTRERLEKRGIVIPGWIQMLIWLIGVVVFTWLTVRFSLPLIIGYFDDDQNVRVKTTIVVNEKYAKPRMYLTMPLDIAIGEWYQPLIRVIDNLYGRGNGTVDDPVKCPECARLANESWDVWSRMNLTDDDTTNNYAVYKLLTCFMEKLLSDVARGDTRALSENASRWNGPIIGAAIYSLIWKYNLDTEFVDSFHDLRGKILLAALDEEYSTRLWNNTHVYDLIHDHITGELCRRMYMARFGSQRAINGRDAGCEDILTKGTLPFQINDDEMKIPLESGENATAEFFWGEKEKFAGEIEKEQKRVHVHLEPCFLYQTRIDTWSNDWAHTMASASLAEETKAQINVVYSAVTRTAEERKNKLVSCSNETNLQLCVAKCTKLWIRKRCSCQPFSFRKGLPAPDKDEINLRYCTPRSYNACDPIKHFTNTDLEECRKRCYNPCEYISYTYNVLVKERPVWMPLPLTFEVILKQAMNPFVQFSNSTERGIEDMIAQIGGMLGLWLGLSGLSILQFVLAVIDFVKRKKQLRQEQRKNRTWAVSLVRMGVLSMMINGNSAVNKDDDDNGNDDDEIRSFKEQSFIEDAGTSTQTKDDGDGGNHHIVQLTKAEVIDMIKSEIEPLTASLQDVIKILQEQIPQKSVPINKKNLNLYT